MRIGGAGLLARGRPPGRPGRESEEPDRGVRRGPGGPPHILSGGMLGVGMLGVGVLAMGMLLCAPLGAQDLSGQLLTLKRVYVDKLTGGETAAQMRDLLISSLHNSKLFILTENQDRADAVLRGAAEDLIYTDQFSSSDGVNLKSDVSAGNRSGRATSTGRSASLGLGVGDNESSNIHERKHEAIATVRLVNKDGDVIWSTTQESNGAKFKGASADVADKITKQLAADYELTTRLTTNRSGASESAAGSAKTPTLP
jgi:hypothetical protein